MNKVNQLFLSILITQGASYAQTVFYPSLDPQSQTTIVFVHGLVDNETQAYNYFKQSFAGHSKNNFIRNRYLHDLEKESLVSLQFDDAGSGIAKYVNAHFSTLGQGIEIEHIKKAYDTHNLKNQKWVIFHGPSRGSAVIINFIAKYNPDNAALILENPFDSVQGGIKHKSLPQPIKRFVYWFIRTIFQYRQDGEHPIEQIKYIKNKNLPIIIVCSEQDTIVHWKSSENLYKAFINNGFTDVTFLKTKSGSHAKILWGPEGNKYADAVHALKHKVQTTKFLHSQNSEES